MVSTDIRTIKSAEVVFDIFEIIQSNNGATLTELAGDLQKAPSTVHQYLATLKQREFVVENGGVYHLSHRFLDFGIYERQRNPLFNITKKKVSQLAAETGERVQFSVAEYGQVIVLYTEAGSQAVQTDIRSGQRLPMHATAAGKAILAYSSPEYVDSVVTEHGLTAVTENTITTPTELAKELESIRESSIAYNDREDTPGLRAIGTPILGSDDGPPLGALSISGPVQRLSHPDYDDGIKNMLLGSANELELRVEYK